MPLDPFWFQDLLQRAVTNNEYTPCSSLAFCTGQRAIFLVSASLKKNLWLPSSTHKYSPFAFILTEKNLFYSTVWLKYPWSVEAVK